MTYSLKTGVALASLVGAVALSGHAAAADLGDYGYKGSIKDSYVAASPPMPSAGPCYFRADVGYSFGSDADITWAQTDPGTGDYLGNRVDTLNFDNSWFGEVGVGCGFAERAIGKGFRAELMFGYHGKRKVDGEPEYPWNDPTPEDDPLHTEVWSYTAMLNIYKDLGTYGRFTPYVGAGMGVAYNQTDEVYFTGNPALVNRIEGDEDLSFAWSLMAGVGVQLTNRATLDLGYRYLDLGEASSGRVDNALFVNPEVNIDDITAHEFKVGLRYEFGGGNCCATGFAPMR